MHITHCHLELENLTALHPRAPSQCRNNQDTKIGHFAVDPHRPNFERCPFQSDNSQDV